MTKQQTIELLNQQLPGFYSVEQVIKIINDIETPEVKGGSLTQQQVAHLCELICDRIKDNVENLGTEDVCDTSSAEFELYGNEIQLSSVDVDTKRIRDVVVDGIGDVVEDFFKELEEEAEG